MSGHKKKWVFDTDEKENVHLLKMILFLDKNWPKRRRLNPDQIKEPRRILLRTTKTHQRRRNPPNCRKRTLQRRTCHQRRRRRNRTRLKTTVV